jgi:hypothetical protein
MYITAVPLPTVVEEKKADGLKLVEELVKRAKKR